jgi:EAL domain-containing protein (putative c-di-GMP-specific phosphodiesterase class I)
VLSDILMPGLEGLDLLKAIHEQDLDLPVVLLTGRPSMDTAVRAVESGAVGYLIKPVSHAKLIDTVDRAVKLGTLARLKREALAAAGFGRVSTEQAALDASLTCALGSLWMAYQPIVDSETDVVHAHEALVRTDEPEFPHPGVLLAAAERLERLPDLGAAIRYEVAAALHSGALAGPVFVNLHPSDLNDPALFDPGDPLARCAHRVVLEITERARLDGVMDLTDRIAALRDLGYRIAIDDLGSGYSGLTSLATLSPDVVKIDMALVRNLDEDVLKSKLVGSIVGVCRELGILVVAEGVERAGEREALRQAGCNLQQGFLFGGPAALEYQRTHSAAC